MPSIEELKRVARRCFGAPISQQQAIEDAAATGQGWVRVTAKGAERIAHPDAPAELRPPPEHADKPQHWVEWIDGGITQVWGWETCEPHPTGIWRHPCGTLDFPVCAGLRGYRYLAPAEWRRQKRFLVTGDDGVVRGVERDARIADLETENTVLRTERDALRVERDTALAGLEAAAVAAGLPARPYRDAPRGALKPIPARALQQR
jgi:hypothetical protein